MKEKMHYFDHERLDVYQAAISFVVLTNEILENLPRGRAYLADQLQRASSSILLNIAEGAGELSVIVSMLSKMVQVNGNRSENASANANVYGANKVSL